MHAGSAQEVTPDKPTLSSAKKETIKALLEKRSSEVPPFVPGEVIKIKENAPQSEKTLPEEQRPARVRIRRCPGFELLAETSAYHNRTGQTYHVEIVKRGGKLIFSVDGNELLSAVDANPLEGGLLGLRTYRTYLRWSNITITSADR